ncbi:MAG: bsn 2 [Bacteroidetes bacterium]|nr:bsn 2 [Bacteroidota bacterium]
MIYPPAKIWNSILKTVDRSHIQILKEKTVHCSIFCIFAGSKLISMKKIFLFVIFSISALYIFAQIPANYYTAAQNKKGYALRVSLYNIIKNHTVISYNGLWEAYQQTDLKENGKIWDMYSDRPGQNPPYEYTYGSDQCGNVGSNEGVCYNREHSIPKSWFNDLSPMVSDLMHIVPTDGKVNGMRSNYPYGDVASPSWTSQNGSKLGTSAVSGYTGTVFEPIDEYKGDFARIYFYMSVCYMDKNLGVSSYPSMFVDGTGNLEPWALAMLIQWSNQDPVSQKEINRNNAAYQLQGNRNPFVDYPELVGKIYGSDSVNVFLPNAIDEYSNVNYISFSNPSNEEIQLFYSGDFERYNEVSFCLYDIQGKLLLQEKLTDKPNTIALHQIPNGIYVVKLVYPQYNKVYKLVIQ